MLFLVDTLSFRASEVTKNNVIEFLGLASADVPWEEGTSFNGYPFSIFYAGIKIGYGGLRGFDCYVHMSGKGCRTWEDLTSWSSWKDFLVFLRSNKTKYHVARIDIACDDFTDRLSVKKLGNYYEQNKYSSRCKYITYMLGSEEIFYCGSPQSDTRLRIYNKKLERGYTDPDDLDGKPWYRAEFQFRDNTASAFIDVMNKSEDIGNTFLGKLREHIRFLSRPNDKTNAQRIPEARWWVDFCNDAARVQFVKEVGSDYNKHKLYDFCFRTAGSSVKTLIQSQQLTPEQLWKSFTDPLIKIRSDQQQFIQRCLSFDGKGKDK